MLIPKLLPVIDHEFSLISPASDTNISAILYIFDCLTICVVGANVALRIVLSGRAMVSDVVDC